jgi:hypothetical protein
VNCLRTLPYLRGWHERYEALGLQIIGVHTPEFPFAHGKAQVQAAVGRLGIRWPVVLDNERAIWTAFSNSAWPTVYLIDAGGYVRYRHAGEGRYAETERAIQMLLKEIAPEASFLDPLPLIRPEDSDGAVCYPSTPELHATELGNSPAETPTGPAFTLPEARRDGRFYLEGIWRSGAGNLTLAGARGKIVLPYHAASVNAVLSPTPHPEQELLPLDPPMTPEILLDGQPLPRAWFGDDVFLDGQKTVVRLDAPRMYSLMRTPDARPHELQMLIGQPGLAFYAFSFGSCLVPASFNDPQTKE